MTLITAHRELYSTPLDILRKIYDMPSESIDYSGQPFQFGSIARYQSTLEDACLQAYGIINGYLTSLYGAPAGLFTTPPYATLPIPDPANNVSTSRLINVDVDTEATTTFWTVTFTSTTAFSVESFHYGAQGSGTTAADFISTNTHIVIDADYWSGTFATNDKFYFSVIRALPMIWTISTDLSTGIALQDIFTTGTSSELGKTLYSRAIDMLRKLVDPNSGISLTATADIPDAIPITYKITQFGTDDSEYLTENEIDY